MMLWDIIRDWFVQYIFGGIDSGGQVYNVNVANGSFGSEVGLSMLGETISISDWLSTTATIITLVLLLIMLFALVRFVIRQVCGLFAKI